jgi:hypothetical protein
MNGIIIILTNNFVNKKILPNLWPSCIIGGKKNGKVQTHQAISSLEGGW